MYTTTHDRSHPSPAPSGSRGSAVTGFVRLLAAAVASIAAAGISPALTFTLAGRASDATADPTGGALSGVSFTQLVVAALGVCWSAASTAAA